MKKKATPKIDELLSFTKAYLDGNMDRTEYELDFTYWFKQRMKQMEKENRDLMVYIYETLIEEVVASTTYLKNDEFYQKTKYYYEQCMLVKDSH